MARSLARAFLTVGGLTGLSRIAGFVRDILTAALLGAGPVADAFFVALKLPNLFRRLTAEGTFQVVFTPMMAARLTRRGQGPALAFAARALAVLLLVLIPVTGLGMLVMDWLVLAIAPGFVESGETRALAGELARITFVYMPLISVVALLGGVLNALERFAPFAAAPILFNACLIAAMLILPPVAGSVAHALAWGVALAGVVQALFLWAACRRHGVRLPLARPRWRGPIARLVRLMGPGAAAAGVTQLNLLLDVFLASLLPAGAIAYLYYADRLMQLPLGIIGIALGVALLPLLSKRLQAGAVAEAMATQNRALEASLLLAVPAALALIAAGKPIIAVLFERGAFTAEATTAAAWALAAYAVGTPGYVVAKVQQNMFFARQDTWTPFKVAAGATATNAVLSVSLMGPLGHVGIALATGLAAWVHVGLYAWSLRRRGLVAIDARLRRRGPRIVAAAAAMAIALAGLWPVLFTHMPGVATLPGEIAALALVIAAGLAIYAGLLVLLGGASPAELRGLLRRGGDAGAAAS